MFLLNNKYSEGFNQEHLEVKQLALRCETLSLTTEKLEYIEAGCSYFQLCFLVLDSDLNLQRTKVLEFYIS